MTYRFLSLEESGNGTDFIMAVEEQPNFWQRLLGRHAETVEFFGPHPHWITMDGMIAPRRVERVLDQFWRSHPPRNVQRAGAAAWKGLEPNAN
ncbi:MAG TPA: hypothetical protein VHY91_11350 [Pirellulales bacterium]|jgi:hypothetical protein|nr:hypothetical protein [Pirellulales bacterium]